MTQETYDSLIKKSKMAIIKNNRAEAQMLLSQAIQMDATRATAWKMLAAVTNDPARRRECLERVMQINPDDDAVREKLAQLDARPAPESLSGALVGGGDRELGFDPGKKALNISHLVALIGFGMVMVLSGLVLIVFSPRALEQGWVQFLAALAIALIIIVLGLLSLVGGVQAALVRYNLERTGHIVEGTIIARKHLPADEDSDDVYEVTYQYGATTDDGSFRKCVQSKDVSEQQYQQLVVGSSVTVRYLPASPLASYLVLTRR